MNGELAQYFVLATHGSTWLGGDHGSVPADLVRVNSAFQFVASVDFAGTAGVHAWLERLAAKGVHRIWLATPDLRSGDAGDPPPQQRAAFAGCAAAGLLTIDGPAQQLWRASWRVGARGAPDHRIWRVHYGPAPVDFGPGRLAVADAAAALDVALARAEEFARRLELAPWDGIFARARLHGSDPARVPPPYHQDLFPDGYYGADCRRLASMAQAAWVFGGMGSWNDVGMPAADAQAEYQVVSGELYAAVLAACAASANAEPGRRLEDG